MNKKSLIDGCLTELSRKNTEEFQALPFLKSLHLLSRQEECRGLAAVLYSLYCLANKSALEECLESVERLEGLKASRAEKGMAYLIKGALFTRIEKYRQDYLGTRKDWTNLKRPSPPSSPRRKAKSRPRHSSPSSSSSPASSG